MLGGSFPGCKAAGALSRPLIPPSAKVNNGGAISPHPYIVHRAGAELSTGTILPLPYQYKIFGPEVISLHV
jgi:hypothetical protein